MHDVQNPGIAEALRAEFKVRGELGQLSIGNLIQPMVIVSDLSASSVASRRYPRDCIGFVSPTAVVAERSQALAIGVGDEGKIYNLTAALITKPGAGGVFLTFSNGAAEPAGVTSVVTKGFMDQRIGSELPTMRVGHVTDGGSGIDGTVVGQVDFGARDTVLVPLNVTLGSGQWILFGNQTTDETVETTFYWTEYLLEDR